MALRASISLTDLQASASTERLTASTAYTKSEATGIWIDPDSKNKMLRDEYTLSDVRFNVFTKNVSDSIPMVDVSAYDFEALKEDSLSLAETFTRAVTYKRAFTDAFTLDDLSQIDKDFYGNKGNIFAFTDIIGLTYNKVFTDSYTVDDVLTKVVAYIRSFTDETTLSDSEYYSLAKNPHNTTTLSDSQSKGFSTNAQDSYYFSDNSVSHTSKVLDNATELINSTFDDDTDWIRNGIINTYTIANGYLKFDITSSQFSSVYQRDICPRGTTVQYSVDAKITSGSFFLQVGHSSGATGNKATFSNSDNQWHTYTGTLVNDGTLAQAFFSIGVAYENAVVYINNVRVKLLELSVTDYTSQAVVKSFSDTIVLDEALIYDTFTNQEGLLGVSDAQEVGATKPLTDVIGFSNELSSHFGKNTGDSLSLAEGISNAINKLSNDSVSTSDADLYSITKSLSDSFALDDAAQIDKNFYGTKGNVFGFSEVRSFATGKNVTNSVSFTDTTYTDAVKQTNDSVSFTDTDSRLLNKAAANALTFSDTDSQAFGKSLSDSFVLDDFALIDKNFYGAKGNAFGLSEEQAHEFSKNAQDSYYFSDNSVSHTSKVLDNAADLINTTFDDDTRWRNCFIPFVGTAYKQSLTGQGIYTIANGYLTFDVLAHQNACVYQENICPWGTTVQYSVDAKITSGSFSLSVGQGSGATRRVTFSNSDNQWHTYTGTLVNDSLSRSNERFYISASGSAIQEPAVVYIDNLQVINPNLVPELSVTDYTSQALGKSLTNDSVSTTDVINRVLSKALADSFTLDDATQVDKDFYGTKGNVLGFSEMQTFVSRKVETDVLPLLEELRNKVTKSNSDSVSFTDSHSSLINKVDFNSLGFTDSNSSVFRKSVYDSFALDDIAQVNKNVEATKGNALNFTESITQLLAYKRTVAESYTFDDDYGVQLNKNLTTDIGITDQVTVVHTLGSNSKALGSTALNTNTLN